MWKRRAAEPELTIQEYKRFLDEVVDLGIEQIEMFGGDALLRKDVLIPFVRYAKKKGINHSDLTTNCNLMDEQTAKEMVDLGFDVIYVSLDGVAELHDKIRGVQGSFERTRKGLELLIKAKNGNKLPRIVANCTVSSMNINNFEKIYEFADKLCVDTVAFEYVGDFPQESVMQSDIEGILPEPYFTSQIGAPLRLNLEQAKLFKKKIHALKEESKFRKAHLDTRNIDVLRLEELVSGIMPNKKCYMCRYLICLDPYGNVLPCAFFDKYSLGNIRSQSIRSIWNNSKHKKFMEYTDSKKLDICKYCILGVERNPNLFQSLRKAFFMQTKMGYDE
jgi:MoaA/NifB/PqqE/SkfB family radical SAM enzyme